MKAKEKGSPPSKVGSHQGNTPNPDVSEGLKGNKKNKIGMGKSTGTGTRGSASPL